MTTPKTPPDEHLDESAPDAPPTEEELRLAAELREALADPTREHVDASLARALALAHAPRDLGRAEHEAIVTRALAAPRLAPRGKVIRVAFGAMAAVFATAAAAIFLFAPAERDGVRESMTAPLACVRSTQPLFREPFSREGGESARIDRIAMARGGDLRDNEFSRWGVR